MSTQALLVRLPETLVRRLRLNVPARRRSAFVQRLLEEALPPDDGSDDDPLYRAALAVERDAGLADEMAMWERATIADGLETPPGKRRRR